VVDGLCVAALLDSAAHGRPYLEPRNTLCEAALGPATRGHRMTQTDASGANAGCGRLMTGGAWVSGLKAICRAEGKSGSCWPNPAAHA
jgi:hypothetical protein